MLSVHCQDALVLSHREVLVEGLFGLAVGGLGLQLDGRQRRVVFVGLARRPFGLSSLLSTLGDFGTATGTGSGTGAAALAFGAAFLGGIFFSCL